MILYIFHHLKKLKIVSPPPLFTEKWRFWSSLLSGEWKHWLMSTWRHSLHVQRHRALTDRRRNQWETRGFRVRPISSRDEVWAGFVTVRSYCISSCRINAECRWVCLQTHFTLLFILTYVLNTLYKTRFGFCRLFC